MFSRRRSDHEGHALHEPVHRGLGSYKSIDGEGNLQNFPGDYMYVSCVI